LICIRYLAGVFLFSALATNCGNAQVLSASVNLPDNPTSQQAPPPPTQQQTPPAGISQSQQTGPAAQPTVPATQTSADQLHAEEKQRLLGVMATFNMTNNKDALPLSPKQKFQLFFKGVTDPWTIGLNAFTAGIGQAENSPPEWKGGMEGYAKRFGAGYADTFDGNLWGNAILTSWWHEDPRYYRKGSGNVWGRAGWAAASSFWCKRDNGSWGPNYANVIGNLIGGSIANLYYPPSQQGVTPTLEHSASVTYYGILGAEVVEFVPDIENHYRNKRREKAATQAIQPDAQQSSAPTKP
jgi:hypothetical protein